MNIRIYRPETDFKTLFILNQELSPDENESDFRKDIENSKATLLLVESKEVTIGFVSVSFPYWDRIAMTHHLIVKKANRNQGAGALLLASAIDHCKKNGVRKLTLRTALWNGSAIKLYKRVGFIPRAIFEDYFGDDNDMVWLDINLEIK